jgi:hypothetical protein
MGVRKEKYGFEKRKLENVDDDLHDFNFPIHRPYEPNILPYRLFPRPKM